MAQQTRAQIATSISTKAADNTTGDISEQDLRELLTDLKDSAVVTGEAEFRVINMTTTTPPGSPADRDAYVVAATATGAWVGQEDKVAVYDAAAAVWVFYTPADGFPIFNLDNDTIFRWDGVSWVSQAGATPTFISLSDTPSSFAGQSLKPVRVNSGETSLEFYTPGSALWDMTIAVSDETTALTTGTAKRTFRMPRAVTLTAVRASVTTAPTGSTLVVDVNEGGVSIFSTTLSIDAGQKTSVGAATPAVISDSSLADDAEITIDIDQVGSTVAGAGLKVTLIGTI